ncbi:MAG: SRPBCC family protein [Thermoplasmatota archaeon]
MEPSYEQRRVFDAPVERVWQAWTDPAMVRDWYGPTPEQCKVEVMDVKEGGVYRRFMGEHLDEGMYHAVEAPARLVQGSKDKAFLVETLLAGDGDQTHMTLRMYGTDPAGNEHMLAAWNAGFDKLDRLL